MTQGMTQWLHCTNGTEMLKAIKKKEMSKDVITNAARHSTIQSMSMIQRLIKLIITFFLKILKTSAATGTGETSSSIIRFLCSYKAAELHFPYVSCINMC